MLPEAVQVILKVPPGIQYGFTAHHYMNDAYIVQLVPARVPTEYDRNSGDWADAEPHSFVFEGQWVKPVKSTLTGRTNE